uniref:14 kDa phosphohistidine phosphatase n=1 Tax=Crocodylus porosus TaxID=8502 RepID=A0A7M4FXW5_CROPO
MADLSAVPDVDIDADGVFKYVLLRVRPPSGAPKDVVRGYGWAEYHADIYEQAAAELEPRGFQCECLGGGRIAHQSAERRIHVYGYSVVSRDLPGRGSLLGGAGSSMAPMLGLDPHPLPGLWPQLACSSSGCAWGRELALARAVPGDACTAARPGRAVCPLAWGGHRRPGLLLLSAWMAKKGGEWGGAGAVAAPWPEPWWRRRGQQCPGFPQQLLGWAVSGSGESCRGSLLL